MTAVHWILDQVRWLIGLAKPDNLKELVNLGGPWWVSYAVLTAIIFAETGLLVGFFLPGDSLLFAAGFLASQNVFNVYALMGILFVAAVVGDAVNYYLGLQMTEHVFEKGYIRFVKHDHLMKAKAFYEKHGGKAIVLARFVPIIRTFTPFVAGVAQMGYGRFVAYNVFGGLAWVVLMIQAGYWLGQIDVVAKNFEKAVIGVIIVSVLPLVFEFIQHWRKGSTAASSADPIDA